jgi:hypothetical protein
VVLRKATVSLSNDDSLTRQFSDIVNGPDMEGVDVIFVIVPTPPNNFEGEGCCDISFRAGLEVSHAVSSILVKNAHALALQVRKGAAAQDGIAALFENIVGAVRDGTAVLVSCSDKGFEGAVSSISGSRWHVVSGRFDCCTQRLCFCSHQCLFRNLFSEGQYFVSIGIEEMGNVLCGGDLLIDPCFSNNLFENIT